VSIFGWEEEEEEEEEGPDGGWKESISVKKHAATVIPIVALCPSAK
jgi:hypothetical protein